ncbi:MAG: hypothetical protein D6718_09890 [Acidobacteria bacterium]|nr:MAG: hypothetical protein D6718_09890 [Acidobacteriota bacterium]
MNRPDPEIGCGFLDEAELEALLADRLADARRRAFEAHADGGCDPCALLRADVECWRQAAEETPERVRREYRASSAGLARTLRERLPDRADPRLRRRLAVAAAAAVLLVAIGVWFRPVPAPPRLALPGGATIALAPPPLLPSPVLRGEEAADGAWAAIASDYAAGRYRRAAARLARLERRRPGLEEAPFYRGVCLLLAGDPRGARDALARARSMSAARGMPTGSIDYYLGLAELASGHLAEGRAALVRCRDGGGPHADAASQVLDLLAGLGDQPPEGSTS